MVIAKVSLDNTFFIRRLMSEIVAWRRLLFECDFGLSYRYSKLLELGKARFVKKELYSAAHFPVVLIIQARR